MPQMTIEYDETTGEMFHDFKKFFGVKTKAAVIRRVLALSRAAKKYADSDGAVRMENPTTGKGETFLLRC